MGGKQSSLAHDSYLSYWEKSGKLRNNGEQWVNKQDNSKKIQRYEIFANDENQFDEEKRMYRIRQNHPQLVSAEHFIQNSNKQFCSSSYKADIFLERIPILLSDVRDVPFPDALHVYNNSLQGFHQLSKIVSFCNVEENQIGINQNGVVKVWLDSAFQKSFPSSKVRNQDEQVRKILQIVDINVTTANIPPGQPLPGNYIVSYYGNSPISFQSAKDKLREYVNTYNNGKIPSKLDFIQDMGGMSYVNHEIKAHLNHQNISEEKNHNNNSQSNQLYPVQISSTSINQNKYHNNSNYSNTVIRNHEVIKPPENHFTSVMSPVQMKSQRYLPTIPEESRINEQYSRTIVRTTAPTFVQNQPPIMTHNPKQIPLRTQFVPQKPLLLNSVAVLNNSYSQINIQPKHQINTIPAHQYQDKHKQSPQLQPRTQITQLKLQSQSQQIQAHQPQVQLQAKQQPLQQQSKQIKIQQQSSYQSYQPQLQQKIQQKQQKQKYQQKKNFNGKNYQSVSFKQNQYRVPFEQKNQVPDRKQSIISDLKEPMIKQQSKNMARNYSQDNKYQSMKIKNFETVGFNKNNFVQQNQQLEMKQQQKRVQKQQRRVKQKQDQIKIYPHINQISKKNNQLEMQGTKVLNMGNNQIVLNQMTVTKEMLGQQGLVNQKRQQQQQQQQQQRTSQQKNQLQQQVGKPLGTQMQSERVISQTVNMKNNSVQNFALENRPFHMEPSSRPSTIPPEVVNQSMSSFTMSQMQQKGNLEMDQPFSEVRQQSIHNSTRNFYTNYMNKSGEYSQLQQNHQFKNQQILKKADNIISEPKYQSSNQYKQSFQDRIGGYSFGNMQVKDGMSPEGLLKDLKQIPSGQKTSNFGINSTSFKGEEDQAYVTATYGTNIYQSKDSNGYDYKLKDTADYFPQYNNTKAVEEYAYNKIQYPSNSNNMGSTYEGQYLRHRANNSLEQNLQMKYSVVESNKKNEPDYKVEWDPQILADMEAIKGKVS